MCILKVLTLSIFPISLRTSKECSAVTAQSGQWVPGPGAEFFNVVRKELGTLPFIAEDLGLITPDVYGLRDQFQLPGMRILQFAFDGHADNPYLPHNYVRNTVVYTGTHDNNTTRGWFEALPEDQKRNVWNYLKRPAGQQRRGSLGTDPFSVVFQRRARYGAIA